MALNWEGMIIGGVAFFIPIIIFLVLLAVELIWSYMLILSFCGIYQFPCACFGEEVYLDFDDD
ncbi:MAG: hypothetical protein AAFP90_07865 [Planctomycetota bacterium]